MFCMLVMDPEFDSRFGSTYQIYTVPILIFFGIASSTITSLGISAILNHAIIVRDAVQAPTAGAIAVASAAYFITNPVYALVIGTIAGIVQTLFQNYVEKKRSRKDSITNTFSFCLFGIQGFIGSIFASGFRNALDTQTDGLTISLGSIPYPVFNFAAACISAGIGIVFGIILGIIFYCTAKHDHSEHFHDYTYWVNDDGIRYDLNDYLTEEDEEEYEETVDNFVIKETNKDIKREHAYL